MKRFVDLLQRGANIGQQRVAAFEGQRQISLQQLWQQSDAIVERLDAAGAKPGDAALLACADGLDWLAAFVAAARCDLVIVIVGEDAPQTVRSKVGDVLQPVLRLDADGLHIENSSASDVRDSIHGLGAALIMFTSGSTALPKGVLISEDNLLANIERNRTCLGLGPKDCTTMILPLSAYMNLTYAMAILLHGGRLGFGANMSRPAQLAQHLSENDITGINLVPSALRLMSRCNFERWPLSKLRYLRVGAGALDVELANRVFDIFAGAELVVTYGMTEVGFLASRNWSCAPVDVGTFDKFLENVDVQLEGCDDDREIVLKSDLLFRGYLHLQPTSVEVRPPTYETGDLGSRNGNVLRLTGRKKAIAKIAGKSVHLDAVCAVARCVEGVTDAAAVAVEDRIFGERIELFVQSQAADPARVAQHIMQQLALPAAPVVRIAAELPRNDMGKISQAALLDLLPRR